MSNEKNNSIFIIDFIFTGLFALYYILPSFSTKYNFLIPLSLGLVYIFIDIIRNNLNISVAVIKYLAVIAFIALLYMLLTDATSISADVSNSGLKRFLSKFSQMFMMFLPLLFLKRITDNSSYTIKKIIIFCSYALILYVMTVTVRELFVNPDITRAWAEFEESSTGNVANYYFVYAIPFTIAVSTMVACNAKKVFVKVIMIFLIIYQMYFLLLAQYTLSVLIAIIGICAELYCNSHLSLNKIILLILFVVLAVASPWIFKTAASYVPSEQMSLRLYEIYDFLSGGDASGYNLNGRMTLYKDSVIAFLRSPVWGNRSLNFDGHATFLTVLADLGLLGGIPFYCLYFSSQRKVKAIINVKENNFNVIFILLLLMGFTNPIHTALPLMYTVWFLVPLTIETYQEYKERVDGTLEH